MTIEAPVFGEDTEADADKRVEQGQGPDNLLEEIDSRGETYEMSDSEKKYHATDLGKIKKINTSEKVMTDLSPSERKEKLYAEAVAFYHEYDRQMAKNPDTANKDLLRKGNQLYEKADALYPDGDIVKEKKVVFVDTNPQPLRKVSSKSNPSLSQIYTEPQVEKKSMWSFLTSWFGKKADPEVLTEENTINIPVVEKGKEQLQVSQTSEWGLVNPKVYPKDHRFRTQFPDNPTSERVVQPVTRKLYPPNPPPSLPPTKQTQLNKIARWFNR